MKIKYELKAYLGSFGGTPRKLTIYEEHNKAIQNQALLEGVETLFADTGVLEVHIRQIP